MFDFSYLEAKLALGESLTVDEQAKVLRAISDLQDLIGTLQTELEKKTDIDDAIERLESIRSDLQSVESDIWSLVGDLRG